MANGTQINLDTTVFSKKNLFHKLISRLPIVTVIFCHQAVAFECIAHRAMIAGGEENTLEAISTAWDSGRTGIELDIQVSADEITYLYHDDTVGEHPTSSLSYKEARALAGQNYAPRLARVLALSRPKNSWILLDLKATAAIRLQSVVGELSNSHWPQSYLAFQSDDIDVLARLHKHFPTSRYFLLSRIKTPGALERSSIASVIQQGKTKIVTDINIKGRRFINRAFVNRLKAHGLGVYVWTINRADRAAHYKRLAVDGIVTDYAATTPACNH